MKIESMWPVVLDEGPIGYASLRERMEDELRGAGVDPTGFSHVGFVVTDLRATLSRLALEVSPQWASVEPEWGEAFGCRIARRVEDGCELEFIEPQRESFLKQHLDRFGPGVQHLSFRVADLDASLNALKQAGAEMADPDVHDGLHGRIAFIHPAGLGGLCMELCEEPQ